MSSSDVPTRAGDAPWFQDSVRVSQRGPSRGAPDELRTAGRRDLRSGFIPSSDLQTVRSEPSDYNERDPRARARRRKFARARFATAMSVAVGPSPARADGDDVDLAAELERLPFFMTEAPLDKHGAETDNLALEALRSLVYEGTPEGPWYTPVHVAQAEQRSRTTCASRPTLASSARPSARRSTSTRRRSTRSATACSRKLDARCSRIVPRPISSSVRHPHWPFS